MSQSPAGPRVLITGASAGIGAALARRYASAGATLGLVARRAVRLEEMRASLEAAGARVSSFEADVTDARGMADAIDRFWQEAGGVDIAIANAGVSLSDRLSGGDPGPAAQLMSANVIGVLNTLVPLVPRMERQGSGHLVAVGSVAGFRGLPGKGAYCASKAAVKTLLDGWRPALRPKGIRVTTICPGYVESELTADNPYPMPFLMGADQAAALIERAIARNAATYVFPWQMRMIVPLLKAVPDWVLPSVSGRK